MNLVRRLLHLLLCLVIALNGAALAHAGAVSGHVHGASVDVAPVEVVQRDAVAGAADGDDSPPCHEMPESAESHASMPMPMADAPHASDAADMPCCDDTATCDHACMPAAAAAALVPERIAPAAAPFRAAVPAMTAQLRAPPPAHPPIRPPIAA